MKIPLGILAIVALLLGALTWLAPPPPDDALAPRTDLPWQITVAPDGTSRVFDLDLGSATLRDAMAKFGALEGLAVFVSAHGEPVLEGYFGDVQFGPLKAKVIVGLAADRQELVQRVEAGGRREGSPSGDWKFPLTDPPEAHLDRRVTAITYIPGTRGLDEAFFRERFGEPAGWRTESEQAVSWFYPRLGLAVLIDTEAREALEYQAPRDFVMPDGVTPNPAYQ